ncbi:MAG: type III-B CRISPR module RAMP protein Cmr6 [Firmicutes bacterium]|jgi:CRISPR-associated protein Cmr6|nr:type III-B CRISPR module RAMP protein Cmr6 [Bacillota bacterium]MDH7494654.1 type III-B CRISPR module RAMP protein Cmr6 [Bacillota bacterium]
MALPLYLGENATLQSLAGNQPTPNLGLVYEKFVDVWPPEYDSRPKAGTRDGFLRFFQHHQADASLLEAYWRRVETLVARVGGIMLEGATAERLVSGLGSHHPLETGFIWHRTLGVPYLPGSSLKGLLSAYARESRGGYGMLGEERALELFGDQEQHGVGRLVVLDVLPVSPCRLELDIVNPHFGPYYREGEPPADVWAPSPVKFLVVPRGVRFRFAVLGRHGYADPRDLSDAENLLIGALTFLGIGAKTGVGYGLFRDLTRVEDIACGAPRPEQPGETAQAPERTKRANEGEGHARPAPSASELNHDEAIKLFQSLDGLSEDEQVRVAMRLYEYWNTTGEWAEWTKHKDRDSEKHKKKYRRVARVTEILARAGKP